MKKTALALLLTFVAASAHAGNILATNYNEGAGVSRPISTVAGGPIAVGGGVVQLGGFRSSGAALDALIAGLTSPAGLTALLADFINFGSSNTIGTFPAEHLYASDKSQQLLTGNELIGKNIYTLIGNAATLAGSSELAIVRDDELFGADAPVAPPALADISAPLGNGAGQIAVVFGNANGPSITTALGAAPSLQLAPIPEPMSAALLLSGLALVVRRRRA